MTDLIRLGVLGCARIVRDAIVKPCAEVDGVELRAVASREPREAEEYAQRFEVPEAYGSYHALLADPEVDLVYIPLPNHLHEQWTLAALQAGKHVLVEKPLCANAQEAETMVAAAEAAGLELIEAFHYRYHPFCHALKATLDDGAIGPLRRVVVNIKTPASLLEKEDIRLRYDCAGGATMDLGAYAINLVRHLTGEEPTVTSAAAQMAALEIDGAMDFQLITPQGVQAEIACSIVHEKIESTVTLDGAAGSILAKNLFLPQFGNAMTVTAGTQETRQRFEQTSTYTHQLQGVRDVLVSGAPCITPARDGIANMRLIDAVYRAAGLRARGMPADFG